MKSYDIEIKDLIERNNSSGGKNKIKSIKKTKKIKTLSKSKTGGRKTKKVRKHQGIIQFGGNKGRLSKGYKYSGRKLKNGLPQIVKITKKN